MNDSRYVYESFESGLWTVGYYDQDGKWRPESDHKSPDEAGRQVNYLNGGTDPAAPQLRELLGEILADLKARNVGHRVEGQMPLGWGSDEYQISLWRERAEQAGVTL